VRALGRADAARNADPSIHRRTVYHVVVVLRADGLTGWGYSAYRVEGGVQKAVAEAADLLSTTPMDLGALLRFELERVEPSATRPKWPVRLATNAIALAAWDLAARRAGVSCASAWGAGDVRELDCYMSDGFFISVPEDELREAAARTRREHFRYVKVRGGQQPSEDVRRIAIVREHFPKRERSRSTRCMVGTLPRRVPSPTRSTFPCFGSRTPSR
jgi:L-alanine-DL-glutamate epimerase-like enolase superfamily enzyme